MGAQLLGRWVQRERDRIGAPPEAPLAVSERAELERLRQENAELRLDSEFLGKAAAFFAAKNTPGRSALGCPVFSGLGYWLFSRLLLGLCCRRGGLRWVFGIRVWNEV